MLLRKLGAGSAGLLALALTSTSLLQDDEVAGTLRPGTPVEIDLGTDGDPSIWEINVPFRATGLLLRTEGSTHDVQIYAAYEYVPEPYTGLYDVEATDTWIDEELLIEVSDGVPLESGTWYVAVVSLRATAEPVRTTLSAELVQPARHDLELGEVLELDLERAHGLRAVVHVELPPDLPSEGRLVAELFTEDADVDLLAGAPGLFNNLYDPFARGETDLNYERVTIDLADTRRGLVLNVYAFQQVEHAERLPVLVVVRRAEDEGPSLCPEPVLPDPDPEGLQELIAGGAVTVFGPLGGGSGTMVSSSGLLLTNAHVVVGTKNGERPDIAVGFSSDPALAPRPVFGAELVEYREDLDLALVRIVGDLLGRPLPDGARFPYFEPVDELPEVGSDLWGAGYPSTGGSTTMVSLTVTRGVVSGYSTEIEGVLLKTDAGIHSGVSGGPCLDARGRLVGLAASSISDSNRAGGLGFVIPVNLVPAEWAERLEW